MHKEHFLLGGKKAKQIEEDSRSRARKHFHIN